MAVDYAEQRLKNQAFVEGVLNLTERLEERSLKRKERKVKEQAADRTIGTSKELDEEAKLKVVDSIEKLRLASDWRQLDELSSTIQGVNTEEEWKHAKKFINKNQADQFGLDLQKDWKYNKAKGKYFLDRSIHTLKQQQDVELKLIEAQGRANRSKYKAEGMKQLLSGNTLGAFQTQMLADPVFTDMGTDDFTKASNMAATTFQDLRTKTDAENERRAAANLPPIQFDNQKAFTRATQQTKEFLYGGTGPKWYTFGLGDPKLNFMSPEEAQERYQEWRRQFIQTMSQRDPTFLAQLQNDPYKIDEQIRAIYQKEQAIRIREDEAKINAGINSR